MTAPMSMLERMKAQKAEMDAKSGRREDAVKPKTGTTRYRVLPTWRKDPNDDYYRAFGQHFIPNGDKKSVYLCDEKTNELTCPICDKLREGIARAMTEESKERIKQANAQQTFLINAIDVEADPTKVIVLALPSSVLKMITDIVFNEALEADALGDVERANTNILTDITKGVDIRIDRSGTGLTTKYSVQTCMSGSKPLTQAIIDQIKDLDAFIARHNPLGLTKALDAAAMLTGIKSSGASAIAPRLAPAAPVAYPAYGDAEDAEFEETLAMAGTSSTATVIDPDDLDAALGSL